MLIANQDTNAINKLRNQLLCTLLRMLRNTVPIEND